jgi:hypothetical protein
MALSVSRNKDAGPVQLQERGPSFQRVVHRARSIRARDRGAAVLSEQASGSRCPPFLLLAERAASNCHPAWSAISHVIADPGFDHVPSAHASFLRGHPV